MEKTAIDLPTFFQAVTEAHDRAFPNRPPHLWFRGQADSAWPLTCAIERQPFDSIASHSFQKDGTANRADYFIEGQLNSQFRRDAAALLPQGTNLVETYFLAQHHGLPTRLLDWTTNSLAALFFCVNSCDESDGAVFALYPSPRLVNALSPDARNIPDERFDVRDLVERGWVDHLFSRWNPPVAPGLVIPVVPDARHGRMSQQSARFTLHLRGCGPIDPIAYTRIRVPAAAKRPIQLQLRAAGVTWASLFPDLEGVAKDLMAYWGHQVEMIAAEPENAEVEVLVERPIGGT